MAKSNFIVRGGADFSGLYKGFGTAQKRMGSFQVGMKRAMTGLGVALGGLAIGKTIKDSITSGMDAIESENLFEVSMKNMADSARTWSKDLQKTLGLNAYEVRKNVGVLYNMTSSMGLTEDAAYKMSTGITELAYDMASFYNITNEEAFEKLRSGLTGEIKPLKNLGILIDDTTIKQVAYRNGIASVGATLTQQQKVQARYIAILEQTSNAQGDLARTIQDPANQLRIFKTQLSIIKINLGNAFMPIVQVVLPALKNMAISLSNATARLAEFSQAFFGKAMISSASNTKAQAAAVADLGDATEEAGKQAKGALAGFDEINQFDTTAGTSSSGAEEVGFSGLGEQVDDGTGGAMEGVASKAEEMASRVKGAFGELKNVIVENKNIIVPAVGAIIGSFSGLALYTGFGALIAKLKLLGKAAKGTWILLLEYPMLAVAVAIGFLVGALVTAYKTNDQFKSKVDSLWATLKTNLIPIIETLKTVLTNVWKNTLIPLGQFISGIFVGVWNILSGAAIVLWKKVLVPLGNFLLWLWQSVFVPMGDMLMDVFATAFKVVGYVFKSIWDNVLKPLGIFLGTVFYEVIKGLIDIFTYLWVNTLAPLGNFIGGVFKGIIEALVAVFQFLWYKVLKPLIDFMGNIFKPVFDNVMSNIKISIEGLTVVFKGLINFIAGVFTRDWKRAWEGVKTIFKGVFDSLYGFVKAPLNLIIKAVNKVIGGLNSINIDIPDWVPKFGGRSFGISIPKIPKLAAGGITNGPTLAMIGDNPGGREVVSPLDDLMNIIASAVGNAVLSAMQVSHLNNQGSGIAENKEIIIQLDGTKLARVLVPKIDSETQRMGFRTILQAE